MQYKLLQTWYATGATIPSTTPLLSSEFWVRHPWEANTLDANCFAGRHAPFGISNRESHEFFTLLDTGLEHPIFLRFSDAAAAHGYPEENRIDLGSRKLILFGNQSGDFPRFVEAANGDFIAVAGSQLFNGDPAPACLEKVLTVCSSDTSSWKGLLGIHVILISKNGRLSILGASQIYTDERNFICSNSSLAMLELAKPQSFDTLACYEYVTNGSVFGHRTLVQGISTVPANAILSINDDENRIHQRPSPIVNEALYGPITLDRVAAASRERRARLRLHQKHACPCGKANIDKQPGRR